MLFSLFSGAVTLVSNNVLAILQFAKILVGEAAFSNKK
jgi:hypothetical protein